MNYHRFYFIISMLLLVALTGCARGGDANPSGKLNVVATSTLIGDVVRQIGGDYVNLSVLVPIGSDPHNYQPVAQDIAAVTNADVVFVNGLDFEGFLDDLIANAGSAAHIVIVSDGIVPLEMADEEDHANEEDHHGEFDPHVWFDPANVMIWAQNVAQTLAELDPAHAGSYTTQAAAYQTQLQELDEWIRAEVAHIPPARRILVTDHDELGYFARQYGFTQVGAVIPSFSTAAAPSAQELAQLQQAIAAHQVSAIFVGTTANPTIAAQITQDTGIQLVSIYTGSLSDEGGPAASYLDFMRYNVTQIVQALQ
ncbi:MAG: metal ABC transporter substrate-binding protein [Candidatus Promineifilaceae bacterium]